VLRGEVPPLRKDRLGRLRRARRRRHALGAPSAKMHLRAGFRPQHQYAVSPPQIRKETDMTITETTAPVASMPRIGDPAPAFTAQTTQGVIDFPADYAGKWVIFFSHPADFTPVCTSEFMTFATMREQFAGYNTELVGLSVDGLYSHIAWLRTIKDKIAFRDMKDVESAIRADR